MTKEDLIKFETEISEVYRTGIIKGPVHLSYGNEDQLIDIFKNVKPEDWVFSTHRNHYHALLKGISPDWLKSEIIAGRSMTIDSPEKHFFSSGIMGDMASIATGVALGLSLRKKSERVWCFVGDMSAEMGVFHESVKYAERNDLPITFIVEDNSLSVCTPTQETWGKKDRQNKIIRYEYRNTRYPHAGVDKKYSGF